MSQPSEVIATLEHIRPLLAGKRAEVQEAVLAELLATWLAEHHVERTELLAIHCAHVCKLTTAKIMGTTP